MLKNWKKSENSCYVWFKKNWQVSSARKKQDCFLLLTLISFFWNFFQKRFNFFTKKCWKIEKKWKFLLCLVQKENWQVSAARNKQDCFLLLTLASFFLKKIFINTSLFSLKSVEKLKKSENICYVWFNKKLTSVSS